MSLSSRKEIISQTAPTHCSLPWNSQKPTSEKFMSTWNFLLVSLEPKRRHMKMCQDDEWRLNILHLLNLFLHSNYKSATILHLHLWLLAFAIFTFHTFVMDLYRGLCQWLSYTFPKSPLLLYLHDHLRHYHIYIYSWFALKCECLKLSQSNSFPGILRTWGD